MSLRSDLPKPQHIYCSNCHDPHGSDKRHILRLDNLDTFSQVQATDYPLCYSCHNETYLMDTTTDRGQAAQGSCFRPAQSLICQPVQELPCFLFRLS